MSRSYSPTYLCKILFAKSRWENSLTVPGRLVVKRTWSSHRPRTIRFVSHRAAVGTTGHGDFLGVRHPRPGLRAGHGLPPRPAHRGGGALPRPARATVADGADVADPAGALPP